MEQYFEAKLELFQPERARRGVVTVDSDVGQRARRRVPHPGDDALDRRPTSTPTGGSRCSRRRATYTSFVLEGPDGRRLETRVPLLGWYMAANAALAIVMLVESGYDLDAIADVLERDGGIDAYIPGRAERISGDRGPLVYIDYGHSPDAFLQTLGAIRRFTTGRRDHGVRRRRRPRHDEACRDGRDRRPRGRRRRRSPTSIRDARTRPRSARPCIEGARAAVPDREIHEIADPRAAFRAALALAGEGDAILYAGPGHEDYHEVTRREAARTQPATTRSRHCARRAGCA